MKTGLGNMLMLCMTFLMLTCWTPGQGKTLITETYNLGLSPDIRNKEARLPKIIEAYKRTTADFLCFQEVWMEKDLKVLLDGLRQAFPYQFSTLHSAVNRWKPAQTADELDTSFELKDNTCHFQQGVRLAKKLTDCARKNIIPHNAVLGLVLSQNTGDSRHQCTNSKSIIPEMCFNPQPDKLWIKSCTIIAVKNCNLNSPVTGFECVTQHCKEILNDKRIMPSCISCMYLHSMKCFHGALAPCTLNQDANNRMNNPGLVILSKKKITRASYTNFHPDNRALLERGYIEAEVMMEQPKTMTVVCTQFSTGSEKYLEYDLKFKNNKAQQMNEIETLNRVFGNRNVALLGDFDMGPMVVNSEKPEKNFVGFNVENYNALISHGYISCYKEGWGHCTLCTGNNLNKRKDGNQLTSHVMVKGLVTCCDSLNRFRTMDGNNGVVLSDHYAIRVDVCM